jgi:hypothetical protein
VIDTGLDQYLVRLVVGTEEQDFRCFASDFGHAEEQAVNAYPDCSVYAIHRLPMPQEN